MGRERDSSHGGEWSGRVDAGGRLTMQDPHGNIVRVRGNVSGRAGKDGKDGEPGPSPAVAVIAEAVMSYFRRFPVKNGVDGRDGKDGIGKDGVDGKDGRTPTKAEVYAAVQDFLRDHPIPLPKHGRDGTDGKKGERGPGPTDEQVDTAVRGFVRKHPFCVPKDGEDGEDGAMGPMPRHELDPPENPHRLRFEMSPGVWGDWLDLRALLPKLMPRINLGVASPSQQPSAPGGGADGLGPDGDKGDVTVGGTGTTLTIDANAVTYAKMQDISATQRVLGRNTAGAGDTEEVTLSQLLDWIGAAAHGDILYRGAATWARLAAGTAGHILSTGGAGANPAWIAPPSGSTPWTTVKKTADENVNNSAALQDDDALKFTMAASTKYAFRLKVWFDTVANADFKYRHTGPAAAVVRITRAAVAPTETAFEHLAVDVDYSAADHTILTILGIGTNGGWIELEGIIHNTTAGDFVFRWAQNTATVGNTTVRAGSYLEWMQI